MPLLADRVQETTSTSGTGTLTLSGAVTGYRTFNASFSNGDIVFYTIDDTVGNWEVGLGTVGTGTLTRDTVIVSSDSNALVNFGSGSKRVFCSAPTRTLLPDQTSNSGKVLTTNATSPSWTDAINGVSVGVTTPAAGNFTTLGATGNVTLGDASTDTVTVNGYMAVGSAPTSQQGLRVASTALVGTIQYGLVSVPTFNSAATAESAAIYARANTEAASFTASALYGITISNPVKGAGSTITSAYGLYVTDQTQGTNNYGITSLVSSGSNKWNIYASGTADNYFAGNVGIGTNAPTTTVYVAAASGDSVVTVGNAGVSGNHRVSVVGGGVGTSFGYYLNGNPALVSVTGSGTQLRLGSDATSTQYQTISLYTNATERIRLDASGTVLLRQSSNAANTSVSLNTTVQNALTLDSSGQLGLGTTAPVYRLHVEGTTAATSSIRATSNAATQLPPLFELTRSRGTTVGSVTAVQSGDVMGVISGRGADGTSAAVTGSQINFEVDGTVSTGVVPGRMLFYTANTSGTLAERLRIDSSGNVGIGTSSPSSALCLQAGTNASLSDGVYLRNAGGTSNFTGNRIAFFGNNAFSGNVVASLSGNRSTNNHGVAILNACASTGNVTANISLVSSQGAIDSYTGSIIFSTGNDTATERLRIDSSGNQFSTQQAPAAVNATATLTVANLQTRIITSTTAAAVTGTLPTGTLMDGWYAGATDMGVDWCVINTGATNTFTVAAGTGHTVVGNMVVAVSSTSLFRSRRTAANTWVTYRVG